MATMQERIKPIEIFDDEFCEGIYRGEALGADEGKDLVDRDEKGHGVYDAEQAEDQETGKPIGRAVGHKKMNG